MVIRNFGARISNQKRLIFANQKYIVRSLSSEINWHELKFPSKVPKEPVPLPFDLSKVKKEEISKETLLLLERLSLVNIEDE